MFTVSWKKSALNELIALWVAADSEQRKAITEATNEIDRELKSDPRSKGESRPKNRRIFFAPPLAILFRVVPNQAKVQVLQVWQY